MKENDGRGARKALIRRVGTIVGFFVMLIGTLHMLGFGSRNQRRPRTNGGQGSTNLRAAMMGKPPVPQTKTDPILIDIMDNKQEVDLILSATVHLVDISHNPGEMSSDEYDGVYGEFCQLNFDVHKTNPSSVPMFRDVVAASPGCQRRFKVNLNEIAQLAREHDASIQQKGLQVPKSMPLTAAVFHESRCGSTLVANTLIAMDPQHHRVYSESPPPLKALTLCGQGYKQCSLEQAAAVFRDVVYLMGRTDRESEQRMFFKIQSAGTHGLEVFQHAFPATPWLFVYREPVQVMMSHLSQGKHANCVRSMRSPPSPVRAVIRRFGHHDVSDMSQEMYCAAHLAAICETALTEMNKSGRGIPVNYDDLPEVLYTDVLPNQLGIPVGNTEIARINEISSVYSKGRKDRAGEWHEDSDKKEAKASNAVKAAAQTFLQHSYDALRFKDAESIL